MITLSHNEFTNQIVTSKLQLSDDLNGAVNFQDDDELLLENELALFVIDKFNVVYEVHTQIIGFTDRYIILKDLLLIPKSSVISLRKHYDSIILSSAV